MTTSSHGPIQTNWDVLGFHARSHPHPSRDSWLGFVTLHTRNAYTMTASLVGHPSNPSRFDVGQPPNPSRLDAIGPLSSYPAATAG